MEVAAAIIVERCLKKERLPISEFDCLFFMDVIQEFCSDHDTLKEILGNQSILSE
jgi:hypothetical protein